MTENLQIRIITPSNVLFDQTATIVTMPGTEGEFGVMPLHAPLIASLKPGIVEISNMNHKDKYFVYGGIARVSSANVDIITEFAINLASVNKTDTLEKIRSLKEGANQEIENDKQEHFTEELLKLESLFIYL